MLIRKTNQLKKLKYNVILWFEKIALHPEYIVDAKKHTKVVVIPVKEWDIILEEIEELNDIRAYYAVKADKKDKIIPFSQAVNEIRSWNNELWNSDTAPKNPSI